MIKSPTWLRTAYKYIGVRELPGPKTSEVISSWLQALGSWITDDETAWCGTFCAVVMRESFYDYPTIYMRAKSWLKWGRRISKPVLGCIVVFERIGGGHVGFLVGMTDAGDLLVLGGNQGNEVKVSMFSPGRVLGYRIPRGWGYERAMAVPVYASFEEYSKNEA